MNVSAIKTTTDKHAFLHDLSTIEKSYFVEKGSDSVLNNLNPVSVATLELDELKKLDKKQIDQITDTLNNLPVVQVSLATYPIQEHIDLISSWARKVLHDEVILEITVNTSLLAGIQISWSGVFFDGSLFTKLHQVTEK